MKSGLRGGFISVSYMCFPLNTWSMAPSIYWPTFATWVHKSGWRCLRAKSLQSCPSLCNPRLLCPWDFPGKSTGSGLSCPPPGDPPENLGYTWVYLFIYLFLFFYHYLHLYLFFLSIFGMSLFYNFSLKKRNYHYHLPLPLLCSLPLSQLQLTRERTMITQVVAWLVLN